MTLQWFPASMSTTPSSMLNGAGYTTFQLLMGTHTNQRSTDYLNFVGADIPIRPISASEDSYQQHTPSPKVRILGQVAHRAFGDEGARNTFGPTSEVNIARYNPQDPTVIASITNSGDILLYNTSLPDLSVPTALPVSPDTTTRVLKHHTKAGYAMDWNKKTPGLFATGSEDATVAIWDANSTSNSPKYTLTSSHSANVTGVKWSPHLPTVLASVSEDGSLIISDTRSSDLSIPVMRVENAHHHSDAVEVSASSGPESDKPTSSSTNGSKSAEGEKATTEGGAQEERTSAETSPAIDFNAFAAINDVDFNPFNEYLLATASADKTAAIWDLRRMDSSVHSLVGHSSGVTGVQWSPHTESVLATGGYDRRVMLWDLSRIGAHDPDEDDDGPAELLFVHGGHTSKISCFEWHPTLPWVMASAGEDNIVQIWKPAQEIVKIEEEHEDEDEEMEDENDEGDSKADN